jgi:hypothetical protein
MIEFLVSLLPVCLGIWAIHILFQEGHALEKQGKWITDKVGEYWAKPLINCPICQSSFWGVIGFFAIRFFFNVDLPYKQIIPFIFCLCGLNTILSKLTTKERIIVEDDSN